MAPEIGKRGVQARADMYSLGLILFEMCYPMRNKKTLKEVLNDIRREGAPIEQYVRGHIYYEVCVQSEFNYRYVEIDHSIPFTHECRL